jgi:uncharacterized protein YndB with AHSA1/START domain
VTCRRGRVAKVAPTRVGLDKRARNGFTPGLTHSHDSRPSRSARLANMWKKVLVGFVALVSVLLAAIAAAPSTYRVERSVRIGAAPQAVYERIADLHRWRDWSAWARVDPGMEESFGGAPSGAGAEYTWSSRSRIGAGRMSIVEARPGERIAIRMELTRPLESTSAMELRLSPEDGGVRVRWEMHGQRGFAVRAAALLARLDAMLGRDLDEGLEALKRISEADAAASGVAHR